MIYVITNLINGKKYIGKTNGSIEKRWYQHQKNAEYGHQSYLYAAMRKYGVDKFMCEYLADGLNEEEVLLIERYQPEYNMTSGGDGGDTSHSPNYQKGMKRRNYAGSNNPNYGKKGKDSPNFGKKRTPEQKKNIASSDYLSKKRKPVKVDGIHYDSVLGAARALGRSERYVRLHDEINKWTY